MIDIAGFEDLLPPAVVDDEAKETNTVAKGTELFVRFRTTFIWCEDIRDKKLIAFYVNSYAH